MTTLQAQRRLAEIRMRLERDRALGADTSTWEAEFFLDYIERMRGTA